MKQTQYLNSPVRTCVTCVHRVPDGYLSDHERFDHCRKYQQYCSVAVMFEDDCGVNRRSWQQKPPPKPRRSLRQWLYDLIWA